MSIDINKSKTKSKVRDIIVVGVGLTAVAAYWYVSVRTSRALFDCCSKDESRNKNNVECF